jgi:hypothetical protein
MPRIANVQSTKNVFGFIDKNDDYNEDDDGASGENQRKGQGREIDGKERRQTIELKVKCEKIKLFRKDQSTFCYF